MPFDKQERLLAFNRILQAEFSNVKELQEIVTLAAKVCGKTSALISWTDQDKRHIKFKYGIHTDLPVRYNTIFRHLTASNGPIVVSDVLADQRFTNSAVGIEQTVIRFYAVAPLVTTDGHHLGDLCVLDHEPGVLTDLQQQLLQSLARQVISLLELNASLKIIQKQHSEARRTETELRAFFESSIDYHLLLGKDFEVLSFNKAWSDYIQNTYNLALRKGASMSFYLHPKNAGIFYKDYSKALKGTAVYVKRRITHVAPYVWHMVKFEPAVGANGEIIGVTINSTDITRKIQQEDMVAAQEQSLRQIALIQSHELRRPVASILGLMSLLKIDGHAENIPEIELLERAVAELDEKIKLVVNYATVDGTSEHVLL